MEPLSGIEYYGTARRTICFEQMHRNKFRRHDLHLNKRMGLDMPSLDC